MGAKRKLIRAGQQHSTTPLTSAIELEAMLAPRDYVQIHQALHFTLGFAERRKGHQIDGSEISQEDCNKLSATIAKVERVLETALRLKRAADDALVVKKDAPTLYRGVEKKLEKRDNEILIARKELP